MSLLPYSVFSSCAVRPTMSETTALGVAMAAGSAEGVNVWSLNPDTMTLVTCDKYQPQIQLEGQKQCFVFTINTIDHLQNTASI